MLKWLRKASRSDLEDLRADMRRLRTEWEDWLEKADRRLARMRMRERAEVAAPRNGDAQEADADDVASRMAVMDPISRKIWLRRMGGRLGLLSSTSRADDVGARRSRKTPLLAEIPPSEEPT